MVTVQEASKAGQRTLAVMPKLSGMLSFASSAYIVYDIVRSRRTRQHKMRPFHHILLGMSICDALASIAYFLSTWPIPRDELDAAGAIAL